MNSEVWSLLVAIVRVFASRDEPKIIMYRDRRQDVAVEMERN